MIRATSLRKTALCYVRQSYTRNPDDMDSPERQRANIQVVCEKNGWIAEFHEDADKHKSGTKEKNRPGWLALKARLGDPDVVAVVANDLARLHRKGWRVGDLIEYLDQHKVNLVLAAPGREIDLSTAMGRLFVQFTAILDEWYAADISQRAKDNIAYRKARGMTVGMPPFGTFRGADGYLKPSREGAWLLTDGRFVAGKARKRPEQGATWKSHFDAARYILTLYAEGNNGLERIAYKFNEDGWAFRDRKGTPRPISRDDVRRVVANWAEYGGIVFDRKAKDRPAYEKRNVNELPFNEERAVFPIKLLRDVAAVRQQRTVKRLDQGVNRTSHFYPLAALTYCAHCERRAAEQNDPRLRSALGGTDTYGTLRYRHKAGMKCGCTNRSVLCEIYEQDFAHLIKLLEVRPEAQNLMLELAIQADKANAGDTGEIDLETQKQEAIALCRRRIDAAVHLYKDAEIDREEYLRIRELNEREIVHWEARTTETEEVALELAVCIEAVERIARLWDVSDEEDRQGLVRSLFEYVVYDLDAQRITDFRLKAWADRFLVLRAALYEDDDSGDNGGTGGEDQSSAIIKEAATDGIAPMGHKSPVFLRRRRFSFSASLRSMSARTIKYRSAHDFNRKSTISLLSKS